MKHAVVVAHPNANSFNLSMAHAYQAAAERAGHVVVLRDLYRLDFEPRMAASELPGAEDFAPGEDVAAERKIIGDADVFVLVYPLWFNSPPAMMKGYVERVFGVGFAYAPGPHGYEPLLDGRQLLSITSSGAPKRWMVDTGAWEALRTLFDGHVAAVCGLTVAAHLHLGEIEPGIRSDAVAGCARQVQDLFATQFGGGEG